MAEAVLFGQLVDGGSVTVGVVGEGNDSQLELVAVPPAPARPKAIGAPKVRRKTPAKAKSTRKTTAKTPPKRTAKKRGPKASEPKS